MISVNVTFIEHDIQSILIEGHANQNIHGKDIVCAGVSAIVYGSINAIDSIKKDAIAFQIKEGYTNIQVLTSSKEIQIMLQMMLIQLQTMEESYGQYIKIKQTHGGVS